MNKHEDERGIIEDLKVGKDWSVTYITFKKGAVRGNHYHKDTRQFDLVLSGELLAKVDLSDHTALTPGTNLSDEFTIKRGDFHDIPPKLPHTYKALEDSEMISICLGKRIGENYEEDTFRLKKPLI